MTGSRPLRVLFDVSHPAHVHLFRHAITDLQADGHETLVTSREKEITTDLLDAYGIDHEPISRRRRSKFSLLPEWAIREYKLVRIARQFEPDVVVSHCNPCAAHAAHLTGARSLVFNDDEAVTEIVGQITHPFTTHIYTPEAFDEDLGPKHRRYSGYHELAYLHPNRFEPDADVLRSNGIDPDSQFFVLRFVSWEQNHDVGSSGFSTAAKRELVEFLSQHGDVYVSTEAELPDDIDAAALPVPPEHVHHLLSYADLYAGDSQIMPVEAGVLGTPSIRLSSFPAAGDLGHFRELESRYSLVLSFDAEDEAVVTAKNLAVDPMANERWSDRREQLLADTIDVTDFMVETIHQQGDRSRHTAHKATEQKPTYELV